MQSDATPLRTAGMFLLALSLPTLANAKEFPYGKSHDYPAFQALDLDSDAQLTGSEIDKAAASLLALDVHEWKTDRCSPEGSAAYLLDNGNLLRNVAPSDWLAIEDFSVGAHGLVEILDWDGKVLWEYQRHEKGRHVLHHDIEPLANGNILVLSYEARTPEQVAALGGKKSTGIRWFEKILEIKPNLKDGSTEVVWEWDVTDHLIQDEHADLPNYGDPAAHPDRLDLNFIRPGERQFHFNSVDYHADRGQLLVSSMNYGEVYVIDRKSGRIIYRWGNPAAYGMGTAADQVLAGQHDARWMDDDSLPHSGDFTVHNNRAGKLSGATNAGPFAMGVTHSAILEVKLPPAKGNTYPREDGKPFAGDITWRYQPVPLDSWYCPFMGCASRLPNGNTLVVNSHNKRVFEVTAEGEMVVNFHIPGPGRVFRIYKIPANHPALKSKL